MATRMLSPDGACDGVTVPFGRGRRYAGTTIEVTDPGHVKALKQAGYTVGDTGGVPVTSGGYTCAECGFSAFFKACGRCGGSCERPALAA